MYPIFMMLVCQRMELDHKGEQGNTQDHYSLHKYRKEVEREDLEKAVQDWVDTNKRRLTEEEKFKLGPDEG